jgi:hypothetical protein
MPAARPISRERAALIARSHACAQCQEYSFKKVSVRRALMSQHRELKSVWVVSRVCGICGLEQEIGLDAEGDIVYGG